jgi:hypothetical protein
MGERGEAAGCRRLDMGVDFGLTRAISGVRVLEGDAKGMAAPGSTFHYRRMTE